MTVYFVQFSAACFVVLTVCVDHGNGYWKKMSREMLEEDIEVFGEMEENIEHQIKDDELNYEDDYPDKKRQEDNENGFYEPEYAEYEELKHHSYKPKLKPAQLLSLNKPRTNNNKSSFLGSNSTWPTFKELLLTLDRMYDWKNDRWIKVKRKQKKTPVKFHKSDNDNTVKFIPKHKFNYRLVKLNRTKSKRNVIIAVKAVR